MKHLRAALTLVVGIAAFSLAGCQQAPVQSDDLIGVWSADGGSIELLDSGEAVLSNVPIEGRTFDGKGEWEFRDLSEGQAVDLRALDGTSLTRLWVSRDWLTTTLYREVCDPDNPECIVVFRQ
jgi:hypothetical protein